MGGDLRDGGCLCGGVRYTVTGEPESSSICHCVSCRRAAGAQSVAWISVPLDNFSFVSGVPAEYRSSEGVIRTFCGACGTSLTCHHEDEDSIDVTTASLDDPDAFEPTHHIWIEDKVGWEGVEDGRALFGRGS